MGNGGSANFDYRQCPVTTSEYAIDPSKDYPKEFYEFMTVGCYWDYYGNRGAAFDADSVITETEVI